MKFDITLTRHESLALTGWYDGVVPLPVVTFWKSPTGDLAGHAECAWQVYPCQ